MNPNQPLMNPNRPQWKLIDPMKPNHSPWTLVDLYNPNNPDLSLIGPNEAYSTLMKPKQP